MVNVLDESLKIIKDKPKNITTCKFCGKKSDVIIDTYNPQQLHACSHCATIVLMLILEEKRFGNRK